MPFMSQWPRCKGPVHTRPNKCPLWHTDPDAKVQFTRGRKQRPSGSVIFNPFGSSSFSGLFVGFGFQINFCGLYLVLVLAFSELSLVGLVTWLTSHCPSVLWYYWLGVLTRKIVPKIFLQNIFIHFYRICERDSSHTHTDTAWRLRLRLHSIVRKSLNWP